MAALDSVKPDPAIERWNIMREDVYKHFKWTRRTTRTGMIGMVLVPAAVYALCAVTDSKYDWRGKRKGESLAVKQ